TGTGFVAESRHCRFGYHLDVVQVIVYRDSIRYDGVTEPNVTFPQWRIEGDVHIKGDFACIVRDNAADSHARAQVQIGLRNLLGEMITEEANSVGLRTGLQQRLIATERR